VLRTRLAVAAAGLPLLAGLLVAPEVAFSVAVTAVLAVAAIEFMRAAAPDTGYAPALAAGVAVALLAATARSVDAFRLWTLLPALALALPWVLRTSRAPPPAAWWALAVLYVGALGPHWLLLRGLEDGRSWLAVGLATTFATDTGAYAAGRLAGRHLLAPKLSPGKTWEGGAGGLVAGAAAALASVAVLDVEAGASTAAVVAASLPAAAIAGDLLESALKRRAGVKDMSRLLPGHGGLLDRMDSLLLTGPLLYWLVRWLVT
jgi:phosphatidate cytidylyltransferase